MATHYARWTIDPSYLSPHLDEDSLNIAKALPQRRRIRFLASRSLLAELIFMLYGTKTLPKIVTTVTGRPHFVDRTLTDFSIAYAGNSVGVALTTEGRCGLDMELRPFGRIPSPVSTFSSNETAWINNQNDPSEARAQLRTLRQSACKLTGSDDELQLMPGAGRLRVKHQTQIEAISDVEDILVWACAVSPAVERLLLWEFDNLHGWHSLKDVQARRSDPDGRIIRFSSQPYEKHHYQTDLS
ncbi:hypothetical protein MUA04_16975 [Enterobacteriaceae bacterium H11S18]|uniref:4'-phosphopantetheinyl transferase family protein n=1 Tax=Dryocola clanedunensis TaxID=2925396 RepID=UPI0022F1439A|nr:hypothetical protein [Dryocola clanedunensis]MCT4711868.1 hypothetical protein [Dryocola clanedunensis]